MIFHCLSIPYSPTRKEISLCAFVQKVYKFCEEMTRRGHTVYHYGHEDSKVLCTEHITVTNKNTTEVHYPNNDWRNKGFDQSINNEAFNIFNRNCEIELGKRIKNKNEIILCWFGFGHRDAVSKFLDKAIIVEPSIGYDSSFAPFKIFESYAQMHKMIAMRDCLGSKWESPLGDNFVVRPGFYKEDFQFSAKKTDTALFLGRITEGKGAKLAYDICNEIKQKIVFAGPNILGLEETQYCKFFGFANIEQRKKLLSESKFLFAPSLFVEPCNWAVIEASFSGTPSITTDLGGFTESIRNGRNGFKAKTRKEFYKLIENIEEINPFSCQDAVYLKFSIEKMINDYFIVFNSLMH